jgi:imidazolonepropionase-like amidohydrolase
MHMGARGLGCAAAAVWMLTLAGCSSLPDTAPACTLAIEHVSVVPMDSERVQADQTVRLDGDRIASVSATTRRRPNCGRVIDGRGQYLTPGLNDMHIHVESGVFYDAFHAPPQPIAFEDVLYLYLAHGVTGVRVMSGAPDILAFRDSEHGPAPRLLVASPMLSGTPPILPEPAVRVVETPQEAVQAVNSYADAGYDFIKIRENLAPPVLRAVIDTAATRHLDVDGHLPRIADPLATGQRGVAHIDELSLRVRDPLRDPAAFAQRLLACRCYVTTTLSVEHNVAAQLRDYDALAARPEVRFVHPLMRRAMWDRARNPYLAEAQDPAFFDNLLQTDQLMVRTLSAAGVPLLAGTDALIPMIIPGDSLHDELALLVQAGLSPYDALRAATRTPSEIFPRFRDVGVIAPGRAANLVLTSGNPLVDVATLRRPSATIIAGVYIDRATLDARLEAIAGRIAAQ